MALYIVGSYLMGCIMSAYFLGKWRGVDLQQQHSGNLGARNAGRTLGTGAFIVTMLGDATKGIVIVILGRYLQLEDSHIAWAILCVVLGHLYPFWLTFRGGKGIATAIGSLLFFSPSYFLAFLVPFLLTLPFIKSTTLSMIVGFIAYGGFLLWLQRWDLVALVLMLSLLIWKHRENIRERVM